MKKLYVKIEGIHCAHCESKIETELLKNKKIKEMKINKNIASISYSGTLSHKEIIDTITKIGYFTKDEYISEDLKAIDSNIKLKEFMIILICIIGISTAIKMIFGLNIFNIIPTIDSSITYGMLVITGVLTSIHCISMCGAVNLMATLNSSNQISMKKPILYNLGRVISYTLIGGIAGFIGNIISINDTINGIIILLASLVMFFMSLSMLGIFKIRIPQIVKWNRKKKTNHAFIIGILNGFMPCGPLQAMQVYALSTNSFVKGALSMFLFGIGTVPLMLFAGVIFNLFQRKRRILLNKIASILILLLSIVMMQRGFLILGIDITKNVNYDKTYTSSVIKNDYQVIEIDLSYNNYDDIIVQKNIPVKLILHVEKEYLTGCNEEIIISEFGIKQKLKVGDNVIKFTPKKTGTYTMTCWMNMIKNNLKVIDDKNYFNTASNGICKKKESC